SDELSDSSESENTNNIEKSDIDKSSDTPSSEITSETTTQMNLRIKANAKEKAPNVQKKTINTNL
ncbi:19683_t:CDS:1, partial [Racocetra fulgida]